MANKKDKKKDNKKERSTALFKEGFCCAQSVFSVYAEQWGLDAEAFLKVADAFGAGFGGLATTCGAVSGAGMVIAFKYGRTRADDEAAKAKMRSMIQEFVKQFRERHGHIQCKHLLEHDISIPEEKDRAEAKGYFDTRCPKYVEDAVDILENLLHAAHAPSS